jgi:hypothetical protein
LASKFGPARSWSERLQASPAPSSRGTKTDVGVAPSRIATSSFLYVVEVRERCSDLRRADQRPKLSFPYGEKRRRLAKPGRGTSPRLLRQLRSSGARVIAA